MTADDERRQLAAVCRDLVHEFQAWLPEERIRTWFEDVVREYDAAAIRTYVPVLAAREARRRLRELARA